MRLVKPSFELLAIYGKNDLPYNYADPERLIEVAGRTCYKSEDKITPDSSKTFVRMLKNRGHRAMIEHSWEVRCYHGNYPTFPTPYLYNARGVRTLPDGQCLIAGNLRAFYEADLPGRYDVITDHEYILSLAIGFNEPGLIGMTAKFIFDRGVGNEWVRHRPVSYGQESTRFCDYSKDKFENHVTFVIPPWFTNIREGIYGPLPTDMTEVERSWMVLRLQDELAYKHMLSSGLKPEQARGELPLCLKTEIVITAPMNEWQHVRALRDIGITGNPHPQMLEVMRPFFSEVRAHVPFFNSRFMNPVTRRLTSQML